MAGKPGASGRSARADARNNRPAAAEPTSGPRAELPRTARRQAQWLRQLANAGDLNSAWQRWTIDELFEGRARLLISLAQQPLESTAAEARDHALDQASQGARLRRAVVRVEVASPSDLWGPEVAAYVNSRTLERFLRRRTDTPALPDARALREGDVFWVVQPVGEAAISPTSLLRAPRDSVEVWDVTAAARQASKHTYDEAVRASEGAEDSG